MPIGPETQESHTHKRYEPTKTVLIRVAFVTTNIPSLWTWDQMNSRCQQLHIVESIEFPCRNMSSVWTHAHRTSFTHSQLYVHGIGILSKICVLLISRKYLRALWLSSLTGVVKVFLTWDMDTPLSTGLCKKVVVSISSITSINAVGLLKRNSQRIFLS